mgnify:CR=1 FL=1|jgi:hypothetical protein
MDLLWSDTGFWPFFFLTFILGGATAFASGRAIASTWRPASQIFLYGAILAAAIRFLNYALFDGYFFLSPESPVQGLLRWALAYIIVALIAFAGYKSTRSAQMARQYSWLAASTR